MTDEYYAGAWLGLAWPNLKHYAMDSLKKDNHLLVPQEKRYLLLFGGSTRRMHYQG